MGLTRPRYSQIYDTDYKQSVRLATTADIGDMSAGGNLPNQIDGVYVAYLDRILVKDQSDKTQNGIYEVLVIGTGSNGTWRRALDANANDKVTAGMTTIVTEGNTNSDNTYRLINPDPIVLGVTLLEFRPITAIPGGPNTAVQFNDGGTITSGLTSFTFDKSNNTVYVGGNITVSGYFQGNGALLTGINVSGLEGNITLLQSDVSNIYANLGATAGTLYTLTSNAAVQAGDIGSLYANAATQAGDISALYSNAATQAGAISDLYSNAAVQAGDIGTLYSNASVQAGDIATLYSNAIGQASDIGNIYANLGAVSGNIASIQSDISTIYSNLGAVSGTLYTLTSNAASQAGDISALYSNAATQAGAISDLYSNASVQAGDIGTLYSNAVTQESEIQSLYSNAAGQAGDISTLYSNAATQAGDITTLYSNAATQAGDISALYSNAATQAGAISDLYSNAAVQAGNIDALYTNAAIQAGNIAALESDVSALFASNLHVGEYSLTSNLASNIRPNITSLLFDKDSGFKIDDLGTGNVVVSLGSTFKTWVVEGQSNLVAFGEDVVQIVAGNNISLTTNINASPYKSLTITNTYGNANIASYLPSYTDSIAANISKNGNTWTFDTDGTLTTPGSVNPGANVAYDLGNVTHQWDNLYAANLFVSATGYVAGAEIITANTFANALGTSLETITYLADYITMNPNLVPVSGTTVTYGTYNFGNLQSVSVFNDYDTVANVGFYSVNDAPGAPAHVEYIGWSGITKFNRVPLHINYTQNSGHTIAIDLYNYQLSGWDTFATYSGSVGWQTFAIGLIDDAPYIQSGSGNVTLRIYHVSSGNVQHRTWIDYVALEQSTTGGQGPRGATGATGSTGATGPGVASGGTAGQILVKNTATNYDTVWSSSIPTLTVTGNLNTANLAITSSVDSTDQYSGALVVSGGAGIAGNLHVGGDFHLFGNLILEGNTNIINTTDLSITDSIINLHTPANLAPLSVNDNRDIGLAFHYYKTQDAHAFLGWSNDTGYLEWYGNGIESGSGTFSGDYGTFKLGNIILVSNVASTSATSGALQVLGGVGIDGNIYANGGGKIAGAVFYNGPYGTYLGVNTGATPSYTFEVNAPYTDGGIARINSGNGGASYLATSDVTDAIYMAGVNNPIYGKSVFSGSSDTGTPGNVVAYSLITAGIDRIIIAGDGGNVLVNIANAATSTTSGALQVLGGVGIGGNLFANAIYSDNYFYSNGVNILSGLVANAASQAGDISTLYANAAIQAGDIATLYSNAVSQESEIQSLYSNAAVQAGNISALYSNAAIQAGNIADLYANAAAQAGDIGTIYANLGAVSGNIASIQSNITTIFSNLGAVSGTLYTLTANAATQAGDISTLYTNAAIQAGNISALYSNASSQESEIQSLYSNAASQAGDISTLYANAALQAGNIADLYANAAVQAGNIASIQSDITILYANAAVQAGNIADLYANAAYQAGQIASGGGGSSNYSNANVASYLPTYSGNVNAAYYFGNGSQLTGIVAGPTYTASNVTPSSPTVKDLWYDTDTDILFIYESDGVNSQWVDLISLPANPSPLSANDSVTFGGNISATNLYGVIGTPAQPYITSVGQLSNLTVQGNITTTLGYFLGDGSKLTNAGAKYSVSATAPAGPNVKDLWYDSSTDVLFMYEYDGVNYQWVDINTIPAQQAFLGNADSITLGNLAVSSNLVAGTTYTTIKTPAQPYITSVGTLANLVATQYVSTSGNVYATGNVYAGNVIATGLIYGNGSQLTGLPAQYSNTNVSAYMPGYLSSYPGNIVATGNITTNAYFLGNAAFLTGLPASYSNANVAAYLTVGSLNIVANTYSYPNGEAVGYTYTLDDISSQFNGLDTSFAITYNDGTSITPTTPDHLRIMVGGVEVLPTRYIADYHNLPVVSVFNRGFYIDTTVGNIVFATAPTAGMSFYGTVQTNRDLAPTFTFKQTPFSALNIMLGP